MFRCISKISEIFLARRFLYGILSGVGSLRKLKSMSNALNQALIAKQLRVSPGTVSRVLRNRPGIRASTRARVLELAGKLGYVPRFNGEEEGAVDRRKAIFVGILGQTRNSDFGQDGYMIGLSDASLDLNVSLVTHHVQAAECERILDPRSQPPAMREGMLSGLILVYRWPLEVVRVLSQHFPCVSIVHRYPGLSIDTVDIDHRGGMEMLADHLYGLGHRKIGFWGANSDLSWSRARFAGYVESLERLGLPIDPQAIVRMPTDILETGTGDVNSYVTAAMEITRSRGISAWMGSSDWSARALYQGLQSRGIMAPQDVSITGFDGSGELITSVSVPIPQLGSESLRRLLVRMDNPGEATRSISFGCRFLASKSTGPAKMA